MPSKKGAAIPPLDLSRDARNTDASGTPAALIESARQHDDVVVLDTVDDALVSVEFPMGAIWREQTGCARFVRLASPIGGKHYALVRE
jgi:hypothetical protein